MVMPIPATRKSINRQYREEIDDNDDADGEFYLLLLIRQGIESGHDFWASMALASKSIRSANV